MAEFTLYGAPFSLYTGKARSYLRYKGINYKEVLSSAKVYKTVIIPKTGVRYIPVVQTPDNSYLQDTAEIIDYLESEFTERSIVPNSPKQLLVSKLFEWYGDEWLLLPAMHYRWNTNQDKYIYSQFGKTVLPNFPSFIQRFIGKKIGSKFRGFVPKLGITDNTIPALEHWYENELLPQLNTHFASHNFLLGDRASIGDFGLMGPLYAHLYLDPAPKKIMEKIAPNVIQWINRMNSYKPNIGDWQDNDEIPRTLMPILTSMFKEFLPHMLKTPIAVEAWKQKNTDNPIPRMIGSSSFTLGNSEGTRLVTPFSQWKLQRVLDVLPKDTKSNESVRDFLSEINGEQLLTVKVNAPVKRQSNVLEWV